MEIGVYHEFHCRPEQTPAEAFAEALAQVEAADRWGLDAIWLAEIHQQPRRSVLTRAAYRRQRHCRADAPYQDRHRRPGLAALPPAAAGRGDRHDRSDQPRQTAFRRRAERQPAILRRLWRALFGEPRAVSRDAGDRQAGVDATELLLRRQVLQFQQCLCRAAALSAPLPADPRRGRQRGNLPIARRGRLSDLCCRPQRLAVGARPRPRCLPCRLQGGGASRERARFICG